MISMDKNKQTLKNLENLIYTARELGFGEWNYEKPEIKVRNFLSGYYLEQALECFKKRFFVACISLSSFSVEACIKNEIERELEFVQDSFVKERYLKFLSKLTFYQILREYSNLKNTNPDRLKIIINYSGKLNDIRNNYIHCKVENFIVKSKNYTWKEWIKHPKFPLSRDVFSDSENSLLYATKIIAHIGVARMTIDRKRQLFSKRYKDKKIISLISDAIDIFDKYQVDFHGYSISKKQILKTNKVDNSLARVLGILYDKKIVESKINIKNLERDVHVIKNFFDEYKKH